MYNDDLSLYNLDELKAEYTMSQRRIISDVGREDMHLARVKAIRECAASRPNLTGSDRLYFGIQTSARDLTADLLKVKSPMQALFDGYADVFRKQRQTMGWQLGDMIKFLVVLPEDALIHGLGELMSYRGYYEDLAFRPFSEFCTRDQVLKECRRAMGAVFTGYKGGEFLMGETTCLWVAPYGYCGHRLTGMQEEQPGRWHPLLSDDDSV